MTSRQRALELRALSIIKGANFSAEDIQREFEAVEKAAIEAGEQKERSRFSRAAEKEIVTLKHLSQYCKENGQPAASARWSDVAAIMERISKA